MFWGMDERLSGLSRKQREREIRRRSILAAAMEVLQNGSYADITMSQIAAKAELSPAALYLFFPNKRCLLAELLFEIFEYQKSEMEKALAAHDSWEEQLEIYLNFQLSWAGSEKADLVTMIKDIFFSGNKDIPPEMFDRFVDYRRQSLALLKGILDHARTTAEPRFDPDFLAAILHGGLESMIDCADLGILPRTPRDYVADFKALVRHTS